MMLLQDFSKGIRLEELNVLLTQTVMVCALSLNMLNMMLDLCIHCMMACANYSYSVSPTTIRVLMAMAKWKLK